jgi:hypothetical protein
MVKAAKGMSEPGPKARGETGVGVGKQQRRHEYESEKQEQATFFDCTFHRSSPLVVVLMNPFNF